MSEERIKELEAALLVANKALEDSAATIVQLKADLATAELATRRLRRNSNRDESNLQDQLAAARRSGRA
jgi:septal ring factor EnvC (AmiA/AmiB activator)